ncbi:penicillin-binding protein 1B [Mergibacter septicus]|uniref:penicillin-binding protein 1B n=1 Tax=Mergibacter septicus TaxID=221402 RepID=UPI001C789082|nr:penicillin-binding protein 1B [Mergibacter septicus]QDJ12537.1 penicillin-binding protein 1B [Mergibacter septicus]
MSNQKKPSSKKKKNNSKQIQRFILKVGLTFFCLAIFYLAYLDHKIRQKMDGQIWQLPAEVYAHIQTIDLKDNLTLAQVQQILLEHGYRQTVEVITPADFKIENNKLTLIRRNFAFPDKTEPQRLLRLSFKANRLYKIEDLVHNRTVNAFRLAPKLIAMLDGDNQERLATPLKEYPRLLIETLLLTEDRNFFGHEGISPLGILRAMLTNLKAGHTVQGGSTLTQQLVKNLFLTNQRTISRKLNEVIMALLLDWRYDKNRILEVYLNEVYLGQNGDNQIRGFALASQFYFGRPIKEISLDQIALLVGMVKGPSLYNPWRHPDLALDRRNVILSLMLEHHLINQSLYTLLSQRSIRIQAQGQLKQRYPAFIHSLRYELRQLFSDETQQLVGAKIFTTMDPKLQQAAEEAVVKNISNLQTKYQIKNLEAAMVVADYHNGEIRAIVGGANPQYAGFNRALTAKRQIGSLVKPSIYLAALDRPQQFQLTTLIENQPITIVRKDSPAWRPRNYNRQYSSPVPLVDALARSLNIPTVNIGMKIGLDRIIELQKKMGWTEEQIPAVPAMLLGSYAISPYAVTKLYQTLANRGKKIPLTTLTAVTKHNGQLLYVQQAQAKQVVSRLASLKTLYAMQQVVARGTATKIGRSFANLHLAGKTGTTNNGRDSWFVGIDGNNVTTIWVGLDNNETTKLTGSSGALPLYQSYLQQAMPAPLQLQTQ